MHITLLPSRLSKMHKASQQKPKVGLLQKTRQLLMDASPSSSYFYYETTTTTKDAPPALQKTRQLLLDATPNCHYDDAATQDLPEQDEIITPDAAPRRTKTRQLLIDATPTAQYNANTNPIPPFLQKTRELLLETTPSHQYTTAEPLHENTIIVDHRPLSLFLGWSLLWVGLYFLLSYGLRPRKSPRAVALQTEAIPDLKKAKTSTSTVRFGGQTKSRRYSRSRRISKRQQLLSIESGDELSDDEEDNPPPLLSATPERRTSSADNSMASQTEAAIPRTSTRSVTFAKNPSLASLSLDEDTTASSSDDDDESFASASEEFIVDIEPLVAVERRVSSSSSDSNNASSTPRTRTKTKSTTFDNAVLVSAMAAAALVLTSRARR